MKHHEQMTEVMRRRERLLANCDAQRDALGLAVDGLGTPISVADRVLDAARFLRRHPVALAAIVAVTVAVERRALWSWARRAFIVWRTYRAFRQSWPYRAL